MHISALNLTTGMFKFTTLLYQKNEGTLRREYALASFLFGLDRGQLHNTCNTTDTIGIPTLLNPITRSSALHATETEAGRADWQARDPVVSSHYQVFTQVDCAGRNAHSTNRGTRVALRRHRYRGVPVHPALLPDKVRRRRLVADTR